MSATCSPTCEPPSRSLTDAGAARSAGPIRPEADQRDIIELPPACRMIANGRMHRLAGYVDTWRRRFQNPLESIFSETHGIVVERVDRAVGIEDHDIARVQGDRGGLIRRIGLYSQREPGLFPADSLDLA